MKGKAEKYDETRVEIEASLERKDTAIRVDSIKALGELFWSATI